MNTASKIKQIESQKIFTIFSDEMLFYMYRDKKIGASEVILWQLLKILTKFDAFGSIQISNREISQKLCVSTRTIQRQLKKLQEANYVVIERSKKADDMNFPNIIHVVFPEDAANQLANSKLGDRNKPVDNSKKRLLTCDTDVTTPRDKDVAYGVTQMSHNNNNSTAISSITNNDNYIKKRETNKTVLRKMEKLINELPNSNDRRKILIDELIFHFEYYEKNDAPWDKIIYGAVNLMKKNLWTTPKRLIRKREFEAIQRKIKEINGLSEPLDFDLRELT